MVQEIIVSTKGGFLSAIECARQYGIRKDGSLIETQVNYCFEQEFDTIITLKRKSGNTTFYFKAGVLNKDINRIKRQAKAIPAKELLV